MVFVFELFVDAFAKLAKDAFSADTFARMVASAAVALVISVDKFVVSVASAAVARVISADKFSEFPVIEIDAIFCCTNSVVANLDELSEEFGVIPVTPLIFTFVMVKGPSEEKVFGVQVTVFIPLVN